MKKIIALVLSLVMMSLCCAALAESTYTCTFDLEALAGVTDMNGFVVAMPNSEINTITLKACKEKVKPQMGLAARKFGRRCGERSAAQISHHKVPA